MRIRSEAVVTFSLARSVFAWGYEKVRANPDLKNLRENVSEIQGTRREDLVFELKVSEVQNLTAPHEK